MDFWRTSNQVEVDFVAYGERGLIAFEIKRKRVVSSKDLLGLKTFHSDYPMTKLYFIYGGDADEFHGDIKVMPIEKALFSLKDILA